MKLELKDQTRCYEMEDSLCIIDGGIKKDES